MRKKTEMQKKIILSQANQIDRLKKEIDDLQVDGKQKDRLLQSVEMLQAELRQIITDLTARKNQYDSLIAELQLMRSVLNKEVFKNRWIIIKLLLH